VKDRTREDSIESLESEGRQGTRVCLGDNDDTEEEYKARAGQDNLIPTVLALICLVLDLNIARRMETPDIAPHHYLPSWCVGVHSSQAELNGRSGHGSTR